MFTGAPSLETPQLHGPTDWQALEAHQDMFTATGANLGKTTMKAVFYDNQPSEVEGK